ncbi:TRAP-type C4-dicarboxylate transport system, substrate-binding protein [Amycolatopsis marina]|uniref:TRAP-type C4-dicarboxylate transport system, substrate-binding protein n=2 Tax=Amycolatopsis marina TaxID=490629 RepID=A0A1I1AWA1_9PSEU|nr:TRAP-type C4-dicarboxylate transport system, substrate-binding protein [Amycolatopsis marina]
MRVASSPARAGKKLYIVAVVMTVMMAACSTGGADRGSGADRFADIPEMTLRVQSANAPDTAPSRAFTVWQEAVEEATDGRLTFEMFYAGALAPLDEVEEALSSGLVDIATHVPAYSPAEFPHDSTVQRLNSLVEPAPLGTLQGLGAQTEFALGGWAEDQFAAQGLKPLLVPAAMISSMQLVCGDEPVRSLAEAEGIRVRVPSEHHGTEATALGMTPTATTNAELYEAVQRGIVDCAVMSPQDVRDLGLVDVIDHWMLDQQAGFSGFSSFHLSMSKSTWDTLPVEAQRVLWDTAGEAYLPAITEGYLNDVAETMSQAADAGVQFHSWRDDLRERMLAHQSAVIDSVRGEKDDGEAVVAGVVETHEKWAKLVRDLGYETQLGSFETWSSGSAGQLQLDSFIGSVVELREAHRP